MSHIGRASAGAGNCRPNDAVEFRSWRRSVQRKDIDGIPSRLDFGVSNIVVSSAHNNNSTCRLVLCSAHR